MKKVSKLLVMAALLFIGSHVFAQKHEYVDLGLPSGTLLATCNVGANYPWEYGNYYAWGETKTKTDYQEKTYKYCKGDMKKLTKYCSYSEYGYNGFTDKLIKLQPVDDVATAQWGSGWCMPSMEQWMELTQCTLVQMRKELNGVYGMLFIGFNGNSLFLPAGGIHRDDELYYAGRVGEYWSSSLITGNPDCAWDFDFGSDNNYYVSSKYRSLGLSVRPVRSAR